MRSDLRLADLAKTNDVPSKLMNVKIPAELSDAIDRIAEDTGATKTAVIIALFNEGLDVAAEKLRDVKRVKREAVPTDRQCREAGCQRAKVAKGLCASHYQQARRTAA